MEAYENSILRGQGLSTYKRMEEHFVFPLDARAHDQSRRQKTALLQAEIRKAVKRSVVAGSSFDRFLEFL